MELRTVLAVGMRTGLGCAIVLAAITAGCVEDETSYEPRNGGYTEGSSGSYPPDYGDGEIPCESVFTYNPSWNLETREWEEGWTQEALQRACEGNLSFPCTGYCPDGETTFQGMITSVAPDGTGNWFWCHQTCSDPLCSCPLPSSTSGSGSG